MSNLNLSSYNLNSVFLMLSPTDKENSLLPSSSQFSLMHTLYLPLQLLWKSALPLSLANRWEQSREGWGFLLNFKYQRVRSLN